MVSRRTAIVDVYAMSLHRILPISSLFDPNLSFYHSFFPAPASRSNTFNPSYLANIVSSVAITFLHPSAVAISSLVDERSCLNFFETGLWASDRSVLKTLWRLWTLHAISLYSSPAFWQRRKVLWASWTRRIMSPTQNQKDILKIACQLFKRGNHRESRKFEGR